MNNLVELKEKFVQIYEENIKREGSKELLEWLIKTDFFIAPASTKYHGSYEGGLLEHSLNVYLELQEMNNALPEAQRYSEESVAVCGLLHDLCKAQFYVKGFRNVKDKDTGKWNSVEVYEVDDKFPCGHGEKSVILIQAFMKLSKDSILSIRWHMSGFDNAVKGGDYSLNKAYGVCKLAVLLHLSDMKATYITESKEN